MHKNDVKLNMFSKLQNINKTKDKPPIIKVIGVGDAGGNAINNMIDFRLRGVKFIAVNTDLQSLEISKAPVKILIGEKVTRRLGAGANLQIGREAALESEKKIRKALKGNDMVFIIAGLGGETGTGATPVIAEICKEIETLTIAVVTKPFSFEGKERVMRAEEAIHALQEVADTVIAIPKDLLRKLVSKNTKIDEMFKKLDEMQLHLIKGITDLIRLPGLAGIDFADIQTIMSKSGTATMGTGNANGKNRAINAAEKAISHPLMKNISIADAKGVILNITSDVNLTIEEKTQVADKIHDKLGDDCDWTWGAVIDKSLKDYCNVTIVTTGIC